MVFLAKCISQVDLCLNYVIMLNNYLLRRAKAYFYLEILALKFLIVEAEHGI